MALYYESSTTKVRAGPFKQGTHDLPSGSACQNDLTKTNPESNYLEENGRSISSCVNAASRLHVVVGCAAAVKVPWCGWQRKPPYSSIIGKRTPSSESTGKKGAQQRPCEKRTKGGSRHQVEIKLSHSTPLQKPANREKKNLGKREESLLSLKEQSGAPRRYDRNEARMMHTTPRA